MSPRREEEHRVRDGQPIELRGESHSLPTEGIGGGGVGAKGSGEGGGGVGAGSGGAIGIRKGGGGASGGGNGGDGRCDLAGMAAAERAAAEKAKVESLGWRRRLVRTTGNSLTGKLVQFLPPGDVIREMSTLRRASVHSQFTLRLCVEIGDVRLVPWKSVHSIIASDAGYFQANAGAAGAVGAQPERLQGGAQ
jgi:hypothetical protein